MSTTRSDAHRRGSVDKVGRKLVQLGFLGIFLYPLALVIYEKFTFRSVPAVTSWLLPWDPMLLLGQALHGNWSSLVVGAPLLLLAFSFIFGRAFCGWICPVGTVLDLVTPLAFWQKRRKRAARTQVFPPGRNNILRYYLLALVAAGSLLSIKFLGLFDPLVIFQRASTGLAVDVLAFQQPAIQVTLSFFSMVFLVILGLELWQPRFWCRNLCPAGAMISLVGRFSLLNRKVSDRCNHCGQCRRACEMNAIGREPHDTDYSDCTFCLECQAVCPLQGVEFGFGALAGKRWQPKQRLDDDALPVGGYQPQLKAGITLTRRQFVTGSIAGVAGLGLAPLVNITRGKPVIRPPGALPEDDFVRTCIICQECVRVCPTGGLRPTLLESGLAGIGTPQLLPRQGGCALNPSCSDLCAQVCPVGAIQPIKPDQLKLGLAEVDHNACLAWDQGARCLVCVEACLVGAAQVYQGRITVDPNKCTGGGRCERGCPVAGSAIHVFPKID